MKDEKMIWIAVAFAAVFAWLWYKKGKTDSKQGGGEASDIGCESGNSDIEANEVANSIKQIYKNAWWLSNDDEAQIVMASSRIVDECGARKVFAAFGVLSTYLYGTGDINYWLGKLDQENKDKVRQFFHGVLTI